jgi:hypothetical protein
MHWLRITLSDSKIKANVPNGWDGRYARGFQRGETEDWLLQWYHSIYEETPPNDPQNPPGPLPFPPCTKAYVVYQRPYPPHRGHSGSFEICVKNLGDHPLHIKEGPKIGGPWGDPISIELGSLQGKTIQPGEEACTTCRWEFKEDAPNKAWCQFEILSDNVTSVNVGDYISSSSEEATGGVFQEGVNDPPNKPSKPSGPTEGKINKRYTYTSRAIDINGDSIQYGWDWDGDRRVDEWTGFYPSGETVRTSYSWSEQGIYEIRVKARDKHGDESEWSDPLTIKMPRVFLFKPAFDKHLDIQQEKIFRLSRFY